MLLPSKIRNPEAVLLQLLRRLGLLHNTQDIIEQMNVHPDYPSILSFSDIATNYGASNSAYRVSIDELKNFPLPFIAHTTKADFDYLLVTSINEYHLKIYDGSIKAKKLKIEDFKSIFSGVILIPEVISTTTAKSLLWVRIQNILDYFKDPLSAIFLFILLIAGLLISHQFNFFSNYRLLFALISFLIGLGTATALFVETVNIENSFAHKLCTISRSNCMAILNSSASIAFWGIKWGDIGFFYFLGCCTVLLRSNGGDVILTLLAAISLTALPYTFYSLYYQIFKIKEWCVLCCIVQGILWLNFCLLFENLKNPLPLINFYSIFLISSSFLVPVLIWIILKPLIASRYKLTGLMEQLRKFKYNSEVFRQLMSNRPKYLNISREHAISLGRIGAANVLTVVTNPFCEPCAKMHNQLHSLIQEDLNLEIRLLFATTLAHDDIRFKVAKHFMSLNDLVDRSVVLNAMHEWYSLPNKNYMFLESNYPTKIDSLSELKIAAQNSWCDMVGLKETPQIYLNGVLIPEHYELRDLKYFF